jgi:cobalt-zinc-cadmium efflux system membrane fusion protein
MKTKLFIALIAAASLISCNSEKKDNAMNDEHEEPGTEGVVVLNKHQREALNLKLGNFIMRNLTTVVKTNGQLEVPPGGIADVTAIIGGNVKEIRVFHGDKVSKGQVLTILEHPDYITLQEDFSEIANRLEYLEKEYNRQKELFENNVGAGKDFQKIKSEFNTAKARYEGLKSRLKLVNISPEKVQEGMITNSVSIISPLSGYVNEVNINVGRYADAKDKLFEITDINAIHADFMVYEKDVHLIKEGQKVHFTVSNRPEEELTAIVFAMGKEFEENARSVHIHAEILEKISGLIPGMYISGHIHTDEKYTRTLPNDAIVTEGTKSYIFILENEDFEEHDHDEAEKHEEHGGDEEHGDDHDEDAGHEDHEGNEEHGEDHDDMAMSFRMVEVITGQKDEGYTEIHLIDSFPDNTQVVMNAAYYLLADMKKEETEHEH